MIKIILKRGRDESLRRFHPWVFSGAIADVQGNPSEGDLVSVHASDGECLAYGHFQVGSIAVRVLSFDDSALSPGFWEVMLSRALQVRVSTGLHHMSDSTGVSEASRESLPTATVWCTEKVITSLGS